MHLPWRRGGTGRNQQAPRGVSGGVLVPSRSPCPLAHGPGRHGGSAGRGRGLAWFRTADGSVDHRFTLRLPPLRTLARWDDRPYVSPLAEVAERGRPPGLVLLSAEAVRLLHWQDGRVAEPARSLYEIEPGEWRDYDAYVGYPGRSPAGLHVAEFDQRVSEWRQRFLRATAQAVGVQVTSLGWHGSCWPANHG